MRISQYILYKKIIVYILALIISIYNFFPIYWCTISAFRPFKEVMASVPKLIPGPFSLESFSYLWVATDFPTYYRNSVIVSVSTTILSILFSIFVAYVCVRFKFFGKKAFVNSILFMYMFPAILLAIPLFILFNIIGLTDTLFGLILADTAFSLPFSIWLLIGYFNTIPIDLEESAMVDGASRITILSQIILPISAPGVATVAIFSFMMAWTDFVFPLILIVSEGNKTATLGLATLIGAMQFRPGEMMAGSFLISVPILIPLMFLSNLIIQGLTAGAVKR